MTPSKQGTPRSLLTPAALHILMSLAEGERHGYGVKADVEERTQGRLRLGPGTLYEAIHRMLRNGWIEVADSNASERTTSRRKTYRITEVGRTQMEAELARLDAIVRYARSRALLPEGGR